MGLLCSDGRFFKGQTNLRVSGQLTGRFFSLKWDGHGPERVKKQERDLKWMDYWTKNVGKPIKQRTVLARRLFTKVPVNNACTIQN